MSEASLPPPPLRWELRARLKLGFAFLLSEFRLCPRSQHAREDQRFGLCGHDKRGPVVSRDVGLSVQNERLSEHGLHSGGGERWTRTYTHKHTFLCCLPVHVQHHGPFTFTHDTNSLICCVSHPFSTYTLTVAFISYLVCLIGYRFFFF